MGTLFEQKLGHALENNLSPDIWAGYDLKPDVRQRLHAIAYDFLSELEIRIPAIDVVFLGSMAGFNWTPESDIDLHIITDYSTVNCEDEIVDEYLKDETTIWNERHDIELHGHEVEIYVQDQSETTFTSGLYSILRGGWLQKPAPLGARPDQSIIDCKANRFRDQIARLEMLSAADPKAAYEIATTLHDRLKKMRRCGLAREGENSVENLVFKQLRKEGARDRLRELIGKSYDDIMSI